MDMSLDEIIKSKPKAGRRPSGGPRRTSARTQILGKPVTTPAQRARGAPAVDAAKAVSQNAEKIIVSNLPADVNESQIQELFRTMVGPLKETTIHYDSQGRTKGVATVVFKRRGDAQKAFNDYNNRLIDGKRPMKIELIVDPSKPPPLTARVGPAPAAAAAAGKSAGAASTRGRRPGGRGGRGPRKAERPPKTAADLDAEMEDYTQSNAPAAAPAAAA